AAIQSGITLGLFNDEDGKIPRAVRKKLLARMHVGDFLRTLYEDELQSAAARRENGELLRGNPLAVCPYDDHEMHIGEHRRAALEYRYYKTRKNAPERAAALAEHIAKHIDAQKKGTDDGTREETNAGL
ncbi:MAG: hypothetical protein IIU58_00555, partial [Clostridia bacterium]|nr:hypothetical protein [Clostridia bacterium]